MALNLPNQITLVRFGLAVAFFVLMCSFDVGAAEPRRFILDWALAVFLVAVISDVLDGWVARRWNQVTSLGRILDPFVDKVLVCGAFVLMLGRNFFDRRSGDNVTGLEAWMIVIVLGRELLVTSIRGFSEAQGTQYAANWFGKIKMVAQSVTVCWILLSLTYARSSAVFLQARTVLIWFTVIFTALSMLGYVAAAGRVLAQPPPKS